MELNTILNLSIQYNLTMDEILLVYLTFLAQDEEGHPEYFVKWFSNGGQERLKELFESLKNKEIILKNYTPTKYNPNEIEFNKNFLKGWIKGSNQLGKELWENYPKVLFINGKYFPALDVTRNNKFSSPEEFWFHYSVQIGHSLDKHIQIMELLEYAKEKNLIQTSLFKFVANHQWETIQYIKENGLEDKFANASNLYTED